VTEIEGKHGLNEVRSCTVEALLYSASDFQLFDSLAVEAGGNVCVATLISGGSTIISPDGAVVECVKVPGGDPAITNIAFGADDVKTAYICSSARGRLYATEWARPGLRLNYSITS
jgi:gluconolactonase